jgi:hypothetical protein
MKRTGTPRSSPFSRSCSSSPLSPGRWTSRTRQRGAGCSVDCRNSSAVASVSTFSPADRSERRTARGTHASSITKTVCRILCRASRDPAFSLEVAACVNEFVGGRRGRDFMRFASPALLCLLSAVAVRAPALGQEPVQGPAGSMINCTEVPASRLPCGGPSGLHWALGCFPRHCCPDDYCPNPYPRQCWPPYPPNYGCVPAGSCGPRGCSGRAKDELTWWFIPTPRALHEALWCQP